MAGNVDRFGFPHQLVHRLVEDTRHGIPVIGHHAIEKQLVSPTAEYPELGQVIAQQQPGRQESDDITLCDLTGTGIQDTAIATLAFQRCQQQQAGTSIVN